jgi:hypothetical protein
MPTDLPKHDINRNIKKTDIKRSLSSYNKSIKNDDGSKKEGNNFKNIKFQPILKSKTTNSVLNKVSLNELLNSEKSLEFKTPLKVSN